MRTSIILLAALLAAATAAATPALAKVQDQSPAGFTVVQTLDIKAPPPAVFAVMTAPARWWSPDHTYSGKAANLTLDARAGGCWCETLPGGGSVQHLAVVYVEPPRLLRLTGALGPLQSLPVAGVMTLALQPTPAGTRLTLTYAVGGYAPGGFADISGAVDGVLKEQAERLKAAAEKG